MLGQRPVTEMMSPADHALIARFIRDAEQRSGCEIIPVITRQSGRYDRAEDIFGVVVALVLVAVTWGIMAATAQPAGAWASSPAAPIGLAGLLGLFLGGFVGGTFLATRIPVLKALFVPHAEMTAEVERAAQACFYTSGLRKAPNAAGVLIYISLFERRVVVLGDSAASAHIGDDEWRKITEVMRAAMHDGAPRDGILTAIHLTGMMLDGAFPQPGPDDTAFADAVVLID